jgi:hypothetical protein
LRADSRETLLLIMTVYVGRLTIGVIADEIGCQGDAALLDLLVEDGKNL